MDYTTNYEFQKFSKLLLLTEDKVKLYNFYINLKKSSQKRLFLYLSFDVSCDIILELLKSDGLLTIDGITKVLYDRNVFTNGMKFQCLNVDCENYETPINSNNNYYKKCPKCRDKMILENKEEVYYTLNALYLNYFDFYLVNDVDKTLYIIRNKFNGNFYLKSSDESFSNWLYLKLISNKCPLNLFLICLFNGKNTNPKNNLLSILKDNGFIQNIDNLNFKPVNQIMFKENNKTYFNLYNGNENLNKIVLEKKVYLSNCQNICELMLNLTNQDEKGLNYLLDVLAMIYQEPWIKTKQLIIFYGEEASGKGTFYDLILKPLFEGYITKILGKKIKSNFNGFMSKNLILVLEEVKADKEEEDTLKELVTEDTILINEKNMPERQENNYLTIFGFSNEQNPISAGKRRGVYFKSQTLGGHINNAPDFRIKYEKNIPLEFESFICELKTRKYNRTNIMKGLETEAKKQVREQNMSVIERFYDELCNYSSISKYVDQKLSTRELDQNIRPIYHQIYKYNEISYIKAEFFVDLYNNYLSNQKFKKISLNKFSEFWQLMTINKDNKKHWRRLISPTSEKKTQYVNLKIIDNEIKKRYEEE
jgi:hypothetical protein